MNSYPLVGPIVIAEVMYHPADNGDAEYVELLNITEGSVTLLDSETYLPWRFTDDPDTPGIDFFFDDYPPVTVEPGGRILLVKDMDAFNTEYAAPEGVPMFEWGDGKLNNAGERIQLSIPGDIDLEGTRYYIRIDRVSYSDGSHPQGKDPWPAGADGFGRSLTRVYPDRYGNDPNNWTAAPATPGW